MILNEALVRLDRIEERLADIEKVLEAKWRQAPSQMVRIWFGSLFLQ